MGWSQLAKAYENQLCESLPSSLVNGFGWWFETGRGGSVYTMEKQRQQTRAFACLSRELVDKHLVVSTVYHKYKTFPKDTQQFSNIRFPNENGGKKTDVRFKFCPK